MTEHTYIKDWKELQGKEIRNVTVQRGGYATDPYIMMTLSHNERAAILVESERDMYGDGDSVTLRLVDENGLDLDHLQAAGWITEEERSKRWKDNLEATKAVDEQEERALLEKLRKKYDDEE